jgi:histidinol-phosphate phosphatase family protein
MKKAVFLDRDGTLNYDPGYLSDPDQLELLEGVGGALSLLKKSGFELIVVSNQSGIARGLIEPEVLNEIHVRLNELLEKEGASIDAFYLCIHHPDEACDCRKPKPKLLFQAAIERGINLSSSFMVGDKLSDLEVGRAAGCQGVALVRTGYGQETEKKPGAKDFSDFIGDGLKEVAEWISSQNDPS